MEERELGEKFAKLRQNEQQDTEALAAAQKKFQEISSGLLVSDNGTATTLPEELMATERNLAQTESQLKQCEMNIHHLKNEVKLKSNELKKSENDYKADVKNQKHMENEVKRLEAELEKLPYNGARVTELNQLQRTLTQQLQRLRENIDVFEARHPLLKFKYTAPDRQFDPSSVKGNLISLFY